MKKNGIQVTRTIEFDMAHRLHNHKGKCRNPHGHRYKLEMTFTGPVLPPDKRSDEGMIIDFGDIKQVMTDRVHDVLDHGMMVCKHDAAMMYALTPVNEEVESWNVTVVPFVPTAENMVVWCVEEVSLGLNETKYRLPQVKIVKARLYETPNSWADYYVRSN